MRKFFASMLIVLPVFVPAAAYAHPGNTDAGGGHYCWTNCEQYGLQTGEYHYHDGEGNAVETYDNNGTLFDQALAERLHGSILLQVEQHGEAWYIRSSDSLRYYMKDGPTAYQMMREFSLGITDSDLASIPSVADTTAMNAATSICTSNALAARLKGEILLQVQEHGEAWYVDPNKCLAIYMQDGDAAYGIMRYLGLGITDADLNKIPTGQTIETEAPAAADAHQTIATDGTFIVGTDVQPGTYRTRTTPPGLCYFERLSGFSGTLDDIITNELTSVTSIVTIESTDAGFSTSDCGTWTTDLSAITEDMHTFGDGTFIVGTDIAPGTYRTDGGDSCYYARLSGFSQSLDDILANDNPEGSVVVTISETDAGFSSSGCGTWSLL